MNNEINTDLLIFDKKLEENQEKLEKTLKAWAQVFFQGKIFEAFYNRKHPEFGSHSDMIDSLNKFKKDFLKFSEYLEGLPRWVRMENNQFYVLKERYIYIVVWIILDLLDKGKEGSRYKYSIEKCRQILHSLPIED